MKNKIGLITKIYLVATSFCVLLFTLSASAADQDLRSIFEQRYQAWRSYINKPEILSSCSMAPYVKNKPYEDILALGVPALPLIMEKVSDKGELKSIFMARAAGKILKRKNWNEGDRIWIWWENGRQDIPKEVDQYVAAWQEAKKRGDDKQAAEALKKLEGVGILGLPHIVNKLGSGKHDLIAVISHMAGGAVGADASEEQVKGWWMKDKAKWMMIDERPKAVPPIEKPTK